MKISNNALNFLLAQYRAIFKRAYVKGIASAVLLTAGLAAGQAQAGNLNSVDLLPTQSGDEVTITGDAGATAPEEYQYIQIKGTATKDDFNGTLTITGGVEDGNKNVIMASGGEITIKGTGTLNIDLASSVTDADLTKNALIIRGNGDSADSNVNIDIGQVNVARGTLQMSDTNSSKSGTVTLAADHITIGNGTDNLEAYLFVNSATDDVGVTLGRAAAPDKNITGSEISVLGGGQLTMQGSGSSGAEVVGNSLRIATGGVMLTDVGTKNTVETKDFTIENGAFKVISGSGEVKETFQGHTATVQSGGNFLVGSQGTWTIADTTDKVDDKEITTQVTFENGSNVQIDGQIVVSGGLLTIESGAGLHATTAPSSNLSGTIVVEEKAQNQGLEIDSSVLKSFLTKGDTYHAITKDDSGAYITAESGSQDLAGSVVLKDGRLTFSDQSVELSNFFFASGDGTSGTAGTIVVSGSGSVIGGNDISIAKALKKDKDTETDITGLHVSANGILTLGDGTDTGLTQLSGSGVTKLTIRDGLNVNVANNGYFVMNGASESVSFVNSDPNWTSEVNGNLEFTSSQKTPVKGQWVFNDNVKLTNIGTAAITLNIGPWNGGGDSAKVDKSSYDTHVAFEGQIINGAAKGGFVGILAQTNGLAGVDTTVDFTQATLSSPNGNGAGLLSFQAYDSAVMKFNGNQFDQILSSSKTNTTSDAGDGFGLVAGRSGTIDVTTPITGDYSFDKFGVKPADNSGVNFENRMLFDGAGILSINGDLGLYTGDKEDSSISGAALNIGEGTIKAKQISLTNYHVTDSKNNTYEAVTLQSGTLAVSQGLTVNRSDTLNVGSAASDVAGIVLESDTLNGTGTLAVSKNVNLNGSGSIDVVQGAWSTEANIYAKGTGGLVLANTTEGFDADDLAEGAYAASFVGKNFKAEGTGTAISAGERTQATFDTMQLSDASQVVLTDGHLLVNGANVTLAEGQNANSNPAYVNPDAATKTSTTAGIDFGTATITVTGAQGVMEFGELATSKLLSLSGDTFTLVKGGIDDANFHVDDYRRRQLPC